ncbi:hypothetical protein ABBQ32_004273 [Trebouxia sp. C0010 RCD-2024]
MWEFWRSKLSKGKTRHKRRDLDTGSDEDSPSTARSVDTPDQVAGMPGTSPENSSHVYFKDIILPASDDDDEEDESEAQSDITGPRTSTDEPQPDLGRPRTISTQKSKRIHRVDRQKLIIILVGLPGRGKTFLCNKLMCYLNWLGHTTRHFNVGQYRRKQKGDDLQDAAFFDHNNTAGMKAREQALSAALDDMESWLATDEAQVAIFDATNSTEERREKLKNRFHNKWQYLYIESICNDPQVLEQNYRYKMMYSPDYKDVNTDEALKDFQDRIAKYEEVYETITDRSLHYIKLIDMVTGKGYMDVNRISGYIPGKMVFFLMQICKAGVARMRKIWFSRHGESEYNMFAKIGGDSNISPQGQVYAKLLPDLLVDRVPLTSDGQTMPVSVWTSTLRRTIQTAELLPFPKLRWKMLDEIQAGIFDGWTYEDIEKQMPQEYAARKKDKLKYRYPSGESYLDVIQRLEPVIIEIERERECVCIVAHQAVLRALYGYFNKIPLKDIPRLEIPLHTLIELTPKPDGTMAEERIPLDVKAHKAEALSSHMQKHLDLRKGPFATPMTPFSSLEGGGESPFARVDSMGTGLDGLSTVASLGGPLALGATMGSFTVPQSLRIARAISNATSIPADVAHHAVSQALMQPGTHGSGSGGSEKLPSPAAIRGSMAMKRDTSKRDRTSPLKNASSTGVSAIPESASGELRALESGTLSQGGVDFAPEMADLGTQTSKSLEENTSSVA